LGKKEDPDQMIIAVKVTGLFATGLILRRCLGRPQRLCMAIKRVLITVYRLVVSDEMHVPAAVSLFDHDVARTGVVNDGIAWFKGHDAHASMFNQPWHRNSAVSDKVKPSFLQAKLLSVKRQAKYGTGKQNAAHPQWAAALHNPA
jgi:hypothetical protein